MILINILWLGQSQKVQSFHIWFVNSYKLRHSITNTKFKWIFHFHLIWNMYHSHMDECQLSIKYRNITKHDIRICFYQICQQTYFFMIKLFPNWSILLFEKFDSWEIYFNFTKSNITTNTHTHTQLLYLFVADQRANIFHSEFNQIIHKDVLLKAIFYIFYLP